MATRYILTGTPGAGKTAILRSLEERGYGVVEEAATDVIALDQARGIDEAWRGASFLDSIVALQRRRQQLTAQLDVPAQFHDRSVICTVALARWMDFPTSAVVQTEVDRVLAEDIYANPVFFVRNLGFVEPTAARRISFEESLEFERVHEEVYRSFGYELVDIPGGPLADRVAQVEALVAAATA